MSSGSSTCGWASVDDHHDSIRGRQPLKVSCDAIDKQQRLPSCPNNLLEFCLRQKGITPTSQQADHRRTRARLLYFVALASGHPDTHMHRLATNLGQQRRFPDPGVTRDQHDAAGTMDARAADDTERRRQRLVAAAQRPVGLHYRIFRRQLRIKDSPGGPGGRLIAGHHGA
jgi:hypothetical protein